MKKTKILTILMKFYSFEWLRIFTLPFRYVTFNVSKKFITISLGKKSIIVTPARKDTEIPQEIKRQIIPAVPKKLTVVRTYFVYILRSLKNGKLYIGTTDDLYGCFNRHNNGENITTLDWRPFELIYYEASINYFDAKERERYLNSNAGQRFLKKRLYRFLNNNQPSRIQRILKIASFIGVQVLLLLLPSLLAILYSPHPSVASWFNMSWAYRQTVTITNNGSTQTNYIVPITIDTQTLISAGKMQSDCDDARFATSAGTEQTYFLEVGCNTTTTQFFVKLDSIASGTSTFYFYYGNSSATSNSTYSGPAQGINSGAGTDGAIKISTSQNINTANMIGSRSCADGGDAVNYSVTSSVAAADTTVTLSSTPSSGCLAVNDEVLIINMQGTSGDNSNVGKYETARITSISTATLTLNHALQNGYDGTTQKIMVQRIPNYTDVTVCTSSGTPTGCSGAGTLTASAWDGTKGGVIFFRANGTVNVAASGSVTVNLLGYRGGAGGAIGNNGGKNGESYDGSVGQGSDGATDNQSSGGGRSGNNATASPNNGAVRGGGGGGGSDGTANGNGGAGGGGGGGYGFGGGGGGGAGDNLNIGGNGGAANSTSSNGGGGGGGRNTSGVAGGGAGGAAGSAGSTATGTGGNVGSGTTSASGGGGSNSTTGSGGGGGGGGNYGDSTLSKLYLGSGGGGGGSRTSSAGLGGMNAGGIIVAYGNTITIAGSISSNGDDATCTNRGAGSGGSILLGGSSVTLGSSIVTATGGARGVSFGGANGCGGGGSDGRIYVPYSTVSGTTNPTMNSDAVPVLSSPSSEEERSSTDETAPVLYYKFDEAQGTTAYDSSTTSNNGSIGGASTPVWKTSDLCISGNCLYFTGSTSGEGSRVSTTSLTSLATQTVGTISFWAKAQGTNAIQNFFSISRSSDSNDTHLAIYYDNRTSGGGNMSAEIVTDGTTQWDFTVPTSAFNAITETNKWHHYELTHNGVSPALYIDGKSIPVSFGTTTDKTKWLKALLTDATNTAQRLHIGNIYVNSTVFDPLTGFIDDVKMYAYVRSATQISADYIARGSIKGVSAQMGQSDISFLNNGLNGYWNMDETSTWATNCSTASVLDNSGNGNNGKPCPNASAVTQSTGKFGKGGLFDGINDYIELPSTTIDTTSPFTISAWIKPTSLASSPMIMGTSGGTDLQFGVNPSGQLDFYGGSQDALSSVGSVIAGNWQHVIATYNGRGKYRFYVNGVDVTSTTDGDVLQAISTLTIGRWQSFYFVGSIDEVRTYNRVLSPVEARQLYNWAPGPVGYWKLDENSGITSYDSSGNGNTGTLNNGPFWNIGKIGNDIKFDGVDDEINVGTPAMLNDIPAITASAWIYPKTLGENNFGRIFDKTTSTVPDNGWEFAMNNSSGNTLLFSVDYSLGNLTRVAAANVITLNQWQYVTVTWDGSTNASNIHFYVNGVETGYLSTTNGSGSRVTDASSSFRIGNDSTGGRTFDGYIDDAKIYNYQRMPNQIIEDMNGGHPIGGSPVGSQLIYTKMDEQSGTTINNSGFGGSTYNGTLTGATWLESTRCKSNGCLNFDTTADTVSFGDVSFVDSIASMSASFWINPQVLSTNKMIVSKANNTTQRVFQIKTDDSTASKLKVMISSSASDTTNYCTTATSTLTTNSWQQFVIVYDGSQTTGDDSRLKIYKNGRLITCSVSGTIPNSLVAGTTSNLKLGQGDDSTPTTFIGFMDEFKLYNSAHSRPNSD